MSVAGLNEVLCTLRLSACFAFSVKLSRWDALGFGAKIATLAASDAVCVGSMAPERQYLTLPELDLMMCLVWLV